MQRLVNNIISVIFTSVKFALIKLLHWRRFHYHLIERFSPNTNVTIVGKGKLMLGRRVSAHTGTRIKVLRDGELIVEEKTSFNYGCMIVCRKSVHVHKDVIFGPNVLVFDHDHDYRAHDGTGRGATKFISGSIEIGEKTWIGANVVLLRNTKIGRNCVVAAGCILGNCEYPDNTLIYQKRDIQTKGIPREI